MFARRSIFALALALALITGCDGCATAPPAPDTVQAEPPSPAEIVKRLGPVADRAADLTDALAVVVSDAEKPVAAVVLSAVGSIARSFSGAVALINADGGSPYCSIPGFVLDLSAAGDLQPITEREAVAAVDKWWRLSAVGLRSAFEMARAFLPAGGAWVGWVDAGILYVDGAREPLIAFLMDPSTPQRVPAVEVAGCRGEHTPPEPADVSRPAPEE